VGFLQFRKDAPRSIFGHTVHDHYFVVCSRKILAEYAVQTPADEFFFIADREDYGDGWHKKNIELMS
jgi:hypothetical protein